MKKVEVGQMKSGRAEDPVEAGRVNAGKIVQFGINLIVALRRENRGQLNIYINMFWEIKLSSQPSGKNPTFVLFAQSRGSFKVSSERNVIRPTPSHS